jgi:hypothetical protein
MVFIIVLVNLVIFFMSLIRIFLFQLLDILWGLISLIDSVRFCFLEGVIEIGNFMFLIMVGILCIIFEILDHSLHVKVLGIQHLLHEYNQKF